MRRLNAKRETYNTNPAWTQMKTNVQGIELYLNETDVLGVVFHGRKKSPTWLYKFKTIEDVIIKLDSEIKKQYDKNAIKLKEKQEKAELALLNRANVKVGDVFRTSWGYDRTITTFHQVVEKTSQARVLVREIQSVMVDGNWMSGSVKPNINQFTSEPKKVQIDFNGNLSNVDIYGHTGYKADLSRSYHVSSD